MNKKTALSAAGALAMTSAAGVTALFLTIGQGASAAPTPAVPATPEVVTEYQVVQVDPEGIATTTTLAATTPGQRTVYEIEYVQEQPAAATTYVDDEPQDYDEYEDEDEYEDDDDD